jgi:hypothetical protein
MNERFTPDDTRDPLREIGGLLLGLAVAMIYVRKGPFISVNPDQWAAFPMFLILALAAVYLYGGILRKPRTGGLRPWQAAHSVFGLVFVALALSQFVDLLGGTPSADLNVFWIFGVTAALAFYAGFVGGVRVQILLGALALVFFLVIVGLDLNSNPPHPFEFGVWPWVPLIIGAIGVTLSFTREASLGDQPRRFVENLRGR